MFAICKGRLLGEETANLTVNEPLIITVFSQEPILPGSRLAMEEVQDDILRDLNDPWGEHPDEHKLLGRMEITFDESILRRRTFTTEFRWPTGFKNTGTRRMNLIQISPSGREICDSIYFDVTLTNELDSQLEQMLKRERLHNVGLASVAFLAVVLLFCSLTYLFGRESVRREKIEEAIAQSGEKICAKCPVILTAGNSNPSDTKALNVCPPAPVQECPPSAACDCPKLPAPVVCPSVPAPAPCPDVPPPVACPPTAPPTVCPLPVVCETCQTCEVCAKCEECSEPLVYNECEYIPECEEPFVYNECDTVMASNCPEEPMAINPKKMPPLPPVEKFVPSPEMTYYH